MPQEEKRQPIVVDPKVGRNDACPCGSGKNISNVMGNDVYIRH